MGRRLANGYFLVLTTPAIEIEPSGDVSYLGVQPFSVHDSYLTIASCL